MGFKLLTDGLGGTALLNHTSRGSSLHGGKVDLFAQAGKVGNGARRLGRHSRGETGQSALGDVGNALGRDQTGHGNTGNSRDLHFCGVGVVFFLFE